MDTNTQNDLKYLVLKGKNKDKSSVRMRVPKNIQFLIEKDFINHSTGTSDIKKAREVRDEILNRVKLWQEEAQGGKFNMLLDKYSNMSEDELEAFKDKYIENLITEYPWAGHPQQGLSLIHI